MSKLEELKESGIEVCKCRHLEIEFSASSPEDEDYAREVTDELDEYLSAFAEPIYAENGNALSGGLECLSCGRRLNGVFGTFSWGYAHGEGCCSNCSWPARAYHRPRHKDGEEMFDRPLQVILQYHPEFVEKKIDE